MSIPLCQILLLPVRGLETMLRLSINFLCKPLLYGRKGRGRPAVLAILFILLTFCLYHTFVILTMPVRFLFINENVNSKCILPDLDPFDKSIMKYVWHPDPIHCTPTPDLVFVDSDGLLRINDSALQYYGKDKYSCVYRALNRRMFDDYHVDFGSEIQVDLPSTIPSDFFRIKCRNSKNDIVYDNLLESVYAKPVLENKRIDKEKDDRYSVFMFGLDSTSRLSAIRKLPKTYDYITNVLNASVLEGYMKVADNTLPNLVAILTGKKIWTNELPIIDYEKVTVDSFPFVWNKFSNANYATFHAEDYPILSTFDTDAGGFRNPPTDHYMRTWMLGMEKMDLVQSVLNSVLMPLEYQSLKVKKTSTLCFGNKPIFQHLINYYKRFVHIYKNKLKFAFSWLSQICHEFINFLELGDNDFYEFFKFLKDSGHLENAFLVFYSDHGSRLDEIRNTFVGRIEERMPLMSIVPPSKFRVKYPHLVQTLQENTKRLISNFDIHETLKDIVSSNYENTLTFKRHNNPRGISLFRPISPSRSCAEAGIPEHYCACYGSKTIATKDETVQTVAKFVVSELNDLLAQYSNICAKLTLNSIYEAQVFLLGLSARGEEENRWTLYKFFSKPEEDKHKRFLVVFDTVPGNAMFEATIDYSVDKGMKLLGDVSRTNKYGNTSICVPERPLRRYCYCKYLLMDLNPAGT